MSRALLIILIVLSWKIGYTQTDTFVFFGTKIAMPVLSIQERDSLVRQKVVPSTMKLYIDAAATTYRLEDWSLVLFLRAIVTARFNDFGTAERVNIMSTLLTEEKINNAMGKNLGGPISLIGIKHRGGMCNFDVDGYKFLEKAVEKPRRLFNIKIVYFQGKELDLSAYPPLLDDRDSARQTCRFFNNTTKKFDSCSFLSSGHFISYSREFPMSLYNIDYSRSPVSPVFERSLFGALGQKMAGCQSRTDSINFLLCFVQTAVKNELNSDAYGYADYPCYPESTLTVGKGDCDDKVMLFAFLLSYFIKDVDFAVLEYDELQHVRLAIHEDDLDTAGKGFVEYTDKKYLIAEVTMDVTVLGDAFLAGGDSPSRIHK